MRQPPVECLFSFLCSTNNNVKRITLIVEAHRIVRVRVRVRVRVEISAQTGVRVGISRVKFRVWVHV